MECIVRGIRIHDNNDRPTPVSTLATAELYWPDLGLVVRGARLTVSEEHGYMALQPLAKTRSGDAPLSWHQGQTLATSARDAILGMYGKMVGGAQ